MWSHDPTWSGQWFVGQRLNSAQVKSPCAIQPLLVPKKNGDNQMCVDRRSINKIIVKYRFPTPRIDDLLDELAGVNIFSTLDLKKRYHQILIRDGNEWKMVLTTCKWLVMPFGYQMQMHQVLSYDWWTKCYSSSLESVLLPTWQHLKPQSEPWNAL